jgi:hypothetical protein
MATLNAIKNNEPTMNASAPRVDMKLEVVHRPGFGCRTVPKISMPDSVGGSTPTSPPATTGVGPVHAAQLQLLGNLRQERPPRQPWLCQGLYLAVSNIETARKELLRRGIEVSPVFHGSNVHTGIR